MSDSKKEKVYHGVEEIKTVRNEAPIPTGRLRDLLNYIERVLCSGRENYKVIMEILSGPNVLSRHKGPTLRATYQDTVADASWQAITTYNHKYHDELKNIVYHMLP
jgi:hypothetical protein